MGKLLTQLLGYIFIGLFSKLFLVMTRQSLRYYFFRFRRKFSILLFAFFLTFFLWFLKRRLFRRFLFNILFIKFSHLFHNRMFYLWGTFLIFFFQFIIRRHMFKGLAIKLSNSLINNFFLRWTVLILNWFFRAKRKYFFILQTQPLIN